MPVHTESGVKLTYEDYLLIPEDGRCHQIIDGEHVVNAAPIPRHQWVAKKIMRGLELVIEEPGLGRVYHAPLDVLLSRFDILQPDIVVLLNRTLPQLHPRNFQGTPDLVVEVLSDSTRGDDRGRKRERYARAGLPEYWLADPVANTLETFALRDGQLQALGVFRDEVELQIVPGARVDLRRVWDE
jgi:Uma2 family endonuclease